MKDRGWKDGDWGNRTTFLAIDTEGSTPLKTKPATGQDPVPVPSTSHSNKFTALQFPVYTAAKKPFRNNETVVLTVMLLLK